MKYLTLIIALAAPLGAQSLWNPDRPAAPLFADTTARQVGDILTIEINEQQTVQNNDQTAFAKDTSLNAALTNFDIFPRMFEPLPSASGNSQRDFNGSARVDRNASFRTMISVVVIDVMPNGNMLVEGTRRLMVDGDRKVIRITGQVRPLDVTRTNMVTSDKVANAAFAIEDVFLMSWERSGTALSRVAKFSAKDLFETVLSAAEFESFQSNHRVAPCFASSSGRSAILMFADPDGATMDDANTIFNNAQWGTRIAYIGVPDIADPSSAVVLDGEAFDIDDSGGLSVRPKMVQLGDVPSGGVAWAEVMAAPNTSVLTDGAVRLVRADISSAVASVLALAGTSGGFRGRNFRARGRR